MLKSDERDSETSTRYDAFISYSHALDGLLAPAVQRALERLAKPWYARRSLRIFRDGSDLTAHPALWSSIERALETSEWYVLLASPEAAASTWVRREVRWWLTHRGIDRLLIMVTGGELVWDDQAHRFDPPLSTALPEEIHAVWQDEPLWMDLREIDREGRLHDRDSEFGEAIAGVGAAIKGVSKAEIFGEVRVQQRRTRKTITVVIAVLALLALLAVTGFVVALQQRDTAREKATVATARQLAATAVANSGTRTDIAQILAVQAYRTRRLAETRAALFGAVTADPALVRFLDAGATVTTTAISSDGDVIAAGTSKGAVLIWDESGRLRARLSLSERPTRSVALTSAGDAVAATDGSRVAVWRADGQPLMPAASGGGRIDAVAIAPSATRVATFDDQQQVVLRDTRTAGILARRDSESGGGAFFAFTGEHTLAAGDGTALLSRWSGDHLRPSGTAMSLVPTGNYFPAYSRDARYAGWAKNADIDVGPTGQESGHRTFPQAPIHVSDAFAISPDGERTALAASGRIYVMQADPTRSQEGLHRPYVAGFGAGAHVSHLQFRGDGDQLLSASGSLLALWDLDQPSRIARTVAAIPEGGTVVRPAMVAAAPDSERAAWLNEIGRLTVARLSGAGKRGADATYGLLAWAPDGTRLVIASYDEPIIQVWDTTSTRLRLLKQWAAGQDQPAPATVAVTSDGRHIVTVDEEGGTTAYDVRTGRTLHTTARRHTYQYVGSAISPDGKTVALSRAKGQLDLLDPLTGRRHTVLPASEDSYTDPVIQFDGNRLLLVEEDRARAWTVSGLNATSARAALPRLERETYVAPRYSTRGRIAVQSQMNGELSFFDADTGETMGTVAVPDPKDSGGGPIGQNTSLDFTPDGSRLLTATSGGSVVLWELSEQVWIDVACRTAGRSLTAGEWIRHTGNNGPLDLPCHKHP